jgi:D-alanine-D-alanine ligase
MKTIGVFFGSRSPEHDVSIITGQLIISELKKLNYKVVAIYIDKQGYWHIGEPFDRLSTFTNNEILESKLSLENSWSLNISESNGILVFEHKKNFLNKKLVIDVAFPALHGSFGEDGTLQGFFEIFNVPYVGCGVFASSVAMDKVATKQFFKANNISTTDFVFFKNQDWQIDKNKCLNLCEKISLPVMVKPPHLGSSIGITKVTQKRELENAINIALHFDDSVLIEKYINNPMDVTCAVIGENSLQASLLQESVFEDELLSYEDKYLKDGGTQTGNSETKVIIPARLDSKQTIEIQAMAKHIYRLLNCSGIARIDFLYEKKTKKYYANEINPLPGTLYHHLWKMSGVTMPELLSELIKSALEKQENKKRITYSFKSSLLSLASSVKLRLKG